jgi:pimeloyl-ACP methyl ester carboxylesterase
MNRILCVAVLLLVSNALPAKAGVGDAIASKTAKIDGAKLHYLTAGNGTPLILLHGYAETSLMWRPLIPALAERFTVIAPDLPGIGDSDIPTNGLDMKGAAIRIMIWRNPWVCRKRRSSGTTSG